MERGPLVEAGPLATDPAVSITREEEEEGAGPLGAGFGGSCWDGCWVSSILWTRERKMVGLALYLDQAHASEITKI